MNKRRNTRRPSARRGFSRRNLAQFLRKRRESLGLTLRDVEDLTTQNGAPIPFATLSRIELAKVDPGVERLSVLLRVYGLSPHVLADLLDIDKLATDVPRETDPEKLWSNAVAAFRSGASREGFSCLRALVAIRPTNEPERKAREKAMLGIAIAVKSLGRLRLAKEIAERLLMDGVSEDILPNTLIVYGQSWGCLGHLELALAAFGRAETLIAESDHYMRGSVHHSRAVSFARAKRFEEALTEINEGLKRYGRWGASDRFDSVSAAYGVLAETEDAMGRHDEAFASAQKAVEAGEKAGAPVPLSIAHTEAGKALLHMNRPLEALPHFESALAQSISSNARYARFLAHYYLWKVFEELDGGERAELERQAAFHFAQDLDGIDVELKDVRQLREDPDLEQGAARGQAVLSHGIEGSDSLAGAHGAGESWS